MNPYLIEGPALISFSGGRTSGYMLKHILDAHGGTLPDDVIVSFQNTGKEMPETLDFVRDCGERWGVEIVWLEYFVPEGGFPTFRQVDYESASRNGEPFMALTDYYERLPNPAQRFCTGKLKIEVLKWYAKDLGFDDFNNAVGLRADEPRRVWRVNDTTPNYMNTVCPLATAGITKNDVAEWWKIRNFDLALLGVDGNTPLGNCDLCYLKGIQTVAGIIRQRPDLAEWWIKMEERYSTAKGGFCAARPSYRQLLEYSKSQIDLFDGMDDETIPCFCTD